MLPVTSFLLFESIVAEEVQPMGSPAVHRIRLFDELEQVRLYKK